MVHVDSKQMNMDSHDSEKERKRLFLYFMVNASSVSYVMVALPNKFANSYGEVETADN